MPKKIKSYLPESERNVFSHVSHEYYRYDDGSVGL